MTIVLPAKVEKQLAREAPVATWYCVAGSNDTYWRVRVPAKAIGAALCLIPYSTGKKQLEYPGIVSREFKWLETEEGAAYPSHEGTAVFTRPDMPRAIHALAMKVQGIPIVAEVDDNYLSDKKLSVQMRYLHDEFDRGRHLNAFQAFDRIVFSTRWLRDYYWKRLRKERKTKVEGFVCGNHVDPSDWPGKLEERKGQPRVGWMGSPSHVWDIKLAYPALEWAANRGYDVKIIGMDPMWFPQCVVAKPKSARYRAQFGFTYDWIPWVDPREFQRAPYPLDIGLAPLLRNEHTLGKSDVKFLEYTMSGAATIASNMEVYNSSIVHGETGFLVGSREEMLRYVQLLVRDENLRQRIVANAQQYVREERTIDKHKSEWKEAICG